MSLMKIKLFFILALMAMNAMAQEVPKIIPPSPAVAAFTKYGDIPVSNYTGIPNINIPLYQAQSRDINVPISVSYHASGIKVNEEASWVGLGWALNAGGVISRTVMGRDDFTNNSGGYHNSSELADITNLPTLGLGESSFILGCSTFPEFECTEQGPFNRNSEYDFEPDQYTFSFPGGSGKYILKRNKEPIIQSKDKVDIVYIDTNQSWEIRTSDGTKYLFEIYETTQDQLSTPIITAWYLTKIISPTYETIVFNYEKETMHNMVTIGEVTEQKSHFVESGCPNIFSGFSTPIQRSYTNVTLLNIDARNGRVVFDFNDQRLDIKGGKKLNNIKVFKKDQNGDPLSTPFKEFAFSYDYFVGDADIDYTFNVDDQKYLSHRLKLESITEKSENIAKPPYQFFYYEGGNFTLPSKASFARDSWGYYNGATNNQSLIPSFAGFWNYGLGPVYDEFDGADRNANPDFTQAFSLKEIIYPTNGKTEFKYESHDYDKANSDINDMSGEINSPILRPRSESLNGVIGQTVIEALDISKGYTNNGDKVRLTVDAIFRCFNPPTPPDNDEGCSAVQASAGQIYFQLFYDEAATNAVPLTDVDFTDGDATTTCRLSSQSVCQRTYIYDLAPGVYYWKGHIDNIGNFDGMSATYSWNDEITPVDPIMSIAGGLRIQEIIDHDGVNASNDIVRKFVYNYWEDVDGDGIDEMKSYGRLMSNPIHERHEVDKLSSPPSECIVFIRMANSYIPLNGTSGGGTVSYDQVSVLYGKSGIGEYGINGKSVFEYENDAVVTYNYAGARPPGIPNITINSNGLLKVQTDYKYVNGNFQEIREITNHYQNVPISSLRRPETHLNDHNSEIFYAIRKRKFLGSLDFNGFELYFYPAIHSEWIRLLSTTEKIYAQDDPDKSVSTVTTYDYESTPVHYQTKKITTKGSNAELLITENIYPADPNSGAPASMWDEGDPAYQHMHSQIIEQKVFRNANQISRTVNNYAVVATKQGQPIIAPQSVEIYPSGTNEKVESFLSYDGDGNIASTQKENDLQTSYLWGYDRTLPIAQAIGSDKQSLENNVASAINSLPAYINGLADLDNLLDAVKGFTSDSKINTWRDFNNALRNSLGEAQITTFTYDPLIGMTSQTDPNGITTFYEYDELNRLKLIKDHEGNILQHYEYHYHSDSQGGAQ